MRAIIIDDEKQAIASLEMELREITPKIEIIGLASSVKEGIALLKKQTPDILFLDIRLNDGLGFDILHEIENFGKFRVIFTTAYDQYALEALKLRAFDYLLKPIDLDELQQSITAIGLESKHSYDIPEQQLDQIVTLSNAISTESKIALNTGDGIYLKQLSEIIHIQSDGNYTKFFLKDTKRPMLISRTLKEFENILAKSGFVRVHYSHLININHLASFHNKDGTYVLMSNDNSIPVSTRKKANLLEILKKRRGFLIG
ncbi:MAG: two-component system LytT family response regulator [Crocinitomix sp.]|jgi:two-component system LytT family response regulator